MIELGSLDDLKSLAVMQPVDARGNDLVAGPETCVRADAHGNPVIEDGLELHWYPLGDYLAVPETGSVNVKGLSASMPGAMAVKGSKWARCSLRM